VQHDVSLNIGGKIHKVGCFAAQRLHESKGLMLFDVQLPNGDGHRELQRIMDASGVGGVFGDNTKGMGLHYRSMAFLTCSASTCGLLLR
jgi:hypothetical protein